MRLSEPPDQGAPLREPRLCGSMARALTFGFPARSGVGSPSWLS